MAITYKTFEGTLSTSTGNHDVTLGGWTETPVAAMVFITGATALNSITPTARTCSVLIDGSSSVSTATSSTDGIASSVARLFVDNTGVTLLTTSGVVEAIGTASLISGGVRFNFPAFPPLGAYKVFVVAWAGDLTSKVGVNLIQPASATNIQHAVGVPSEAVIVQTALYTTTGVAVSFNNIHTGFWCNDNDGNVSINQNVLNAAAVGDPYIHPRDNRILKDVFRTFSLPDWQCSQHANGFTLTPVTTGATALQMAWLSLNFSGSGSPVTCHVDTITTPNSVGPTSQAETGPGFLPGMVLMGMCMDDAFNTLALDGRAGVWGFGSFTADDEFSCCTTDEDAAATMNTSCLMDNVAGRALAHDQNPGVSAAFSSMDANGFTLSYTSGASWLQRKWVYIAFENLVPTDYDICTSGSWSSVVAFSACDNLRLELTGPATDDVSASVTVELEGT